MKKKELNMEEILQHLARYPLADVAEKFKMSRKKITELALEHAYAKRRIVKKKRSRKGDK